MKKFLGFKIAPSAIQAIDLDKHGSRKSSGLTLDKLRRAKRLLDESKLDEKARMVLIGNAKIYENSFGKKPPRGLKFPLVIHLPT